MTQEQKAKAYDEALEKARKLYNDAKANEYTSDMEDYESIFPELAESEDERIRMALVEYFAPPVPFTEVCGMPVQKIRDWLEKQKEQKPVSVFTFDDILALESAMDMAKHDNDSDLYNALQNIFETVHDIYHGEVPKPAEWSEEDESFLDSIEEAIHSYYDLNHAPQYDYWLEEKLKSLRSQPKPEWSEEDEEMIANIISSLHGYMCVISGSKNYNNHETYIQKEIEFLNALRPSWKPSEEQMKALKNSAYGTYQNGDGPVLRGLYEQLLKLGVK